MTKARSSTVKRTAILAALIGAVATIIAAAVSILPSLLNKPTNSVEPLTVRVADDKGASVSGAKVLLFFPGGPLSKFTDTNGSAGFALPATDNARLIVEGDQYEIYEQGFATPRDKTLDVRLKPRAGSQASVIFHVVDDDKGKPISGAKVLLLVQGDVLNQVTDSNGIAKYTFTFPTEGKIDARMSVETTDYEVNDQNITLSPNRVQDVRLNPTQNTLRMAEVAAQSQVSSSSSTKPEASAPSPATNRNGVVIDTLASSLVDLSAGYSESSESAPSEKNEGELMVVIRTPDNQPFVNTYVVITKQKTDLNNQPIRGDDVTSFRTDATGSGTAPLSPGTYAVFMDIPGVSWPALNFNHQVQADARTKLIVVPSRFIIVIRRADNSLITNSYIKVSTQKKDANGNSLPDQPVREDRTHDTGEVSFDLTPGSYAIYLDAARGEEWGTLDNVLPPATQLTYNVTLGRVKIESRDEQSNVSSGFYSRVAFIKKDANGNEILGEQIMDGRTDDTGALNFDLTPGSYLVQSEAGTARVQVKSGETVIVKNTDFKK